MKPDLILIGAGIVGLVAAFRAQRAGLSVCLYEKDGLGAGSSGKSLGLLIPSTMKRGIDAQQREGCAAWPTLAAEIEEATGTPRSTFWREWPNAEYPGRQQVRLPLVFELLHQGFTKAGGIYETREILPADLTTLAQTTRQLVATAGFGSGALGLPNMKVMAGQALRILPPAPVETLYVGDNVYVCPDWDGTALIGSVSWEAEAPGDGTPTPESTQELLTRALTQKPELEGLKVMESWVGYRPLSAPRMPLLQPLAGLPNAYAVPGLGKIGVGVAPSVAKAVMALL